MSEGVNGSTAFFYALWDSKTKGLRINPFVVLPVEVW
jgi:hypothetical protein